MYRVHFVLEFLINPMSNLVFLFHLLLHVDIILPFDRWLHAELVHPFDR